MKVITSKTITRFDELKEGDVFDISEEEYYIKIKPIKHSEYTGDDAVAFMTYNAVSLETGKAVMFWSDAEITGVPQHIKVCF